MEARRAKLLVPEQAHLARVLACEVMLNAPVGIKHHDSDVRSKQQKLSHFLPPEGFMICFPTVRRPSSCKGYHIQKYRYKFSVHPNSFDTKS